MPRCRKCFGTDWNMDVRVVGEPWINEDGHETAKIADFIGMQCVTCGHKAETTRKDMFDIGEDPDCTWWL